jgi:predicted ABC-type ATPase
LPDLLIIAGPNGAGKTTFAREYLGTELRYEFVNADEIARLVSLEHPVSQAKLDIRAGRVMLERIEGLVGSSASFAIETTLATLSHARKIPEWRQLGYIVSLIYLRLPSVDDSLARVQKRVEAGGHSIPEDVIRRRFVKSIEYFETIYKPIVDRWSMHESEEGKFTLVESSPL